MNVYLVGVNHGYQLEGFNNTNWVGFSSFLENQVQQKKIDLIAEELSQDAIDTVWRSQGVIGSVAKKVAGKLTITHLFCDPDLKTRHQLGVKSSQELYKELGYGPVITDAQFQEVNEIQKKLFPVREAFWKDRLLETRFTNCLFILGSEHIDGFKRLLETEKLKVESVTNDYVS